MPPTASGMGGQADIDLAFFQVARQRLAADQVLTFIVSLAEFTLQRINLLAEGSAFVLRQGADRAEELTHRATPAQILCAPGREFLAVSNFVEDDERLVAQLVDRL